MKPVTTLLLKVFVKQFYLINTGFFLFCFYFFFGVVTPGQLVWYHQSLILGMLGSPVFLGIVFLLWFLYMLKCCSFCTTVIKSNESIYLQCLQALSKNKQWLLYLLISLLLYLPVIIYSCFVIYTALLKILLLKAFIVTAFQLLLIGFGACVNFAAINKSNKTKRLDVLISKIISLASFRTGYLFYLSAFTFHSKKITFTIIKLFSILLLSISFVLNGDNFDLDFFMIFFLLIIIAHAAMVFYYVEFKETMLPFSRNLPLALYKVAAMYVGTFCIILLPEFLFMLINNHGNLPTADIICFYLIAVACLFLFTAVLYTDSLNMDRYIQLVFVIFILLFFFLKSGMYLLTLLATLFAAAAIFREHYYSFEKSCT